MSLLPKEQRRFSLRWCVAIGVVIALIATILSVYKVSLHSPHLQSRDWEIGVASTTVLVDTPSSEILNLHATADDFGSLQDRAVLLGNLIATDPVTNRIAKLMGVSPSVIQATAPVTANVPQTLTEPGSGASALDILASGDHYKIQIQADPSVPILHIYAQAPSGPAAVSLASDTVTGLEQYLHQLGGTEGVNADSGVALRQLGVAHGGVINGGVSKEVAMLTFFTVFALACWVLVALSRVSLGWSLAAPTIHSSR